MILIQPLTISAKFSRLESLRRVLLSAPSALLSPDPAGWAFQLTQREVEYVALSRDTTESDLKQRREIRAGSAHYVDQVSCQRRRTGSEAGECLPAGSASGGSRVLSLTPLGYMI